MDNLRLNINDEGKYDLRNGELVILFDDIKETTILGGGLKLIYMDLSTTILMRGLEAIDSRDRQQIKEIFNL